MLSVCYYQVWTAAILLLICNVPDRISASTVTTGPQATPNSNSLAATCEFRTINYITDYLPQLCGKSSWSNINVTSATKSTEGADSTVEDLPSQATPSSPVADSYTTSSQDSTTQDEAVSNTSASSSPTTTANEQAVDLEGGELNDASFLSFEEWKKQTLEKAGQANANIGHKRSGEKKDSESFQSSLDSLGDDGEIDLDFGAFGSESNREEVSYTADAMETNSPQNEGALRQYRSKDAGITCKERFSYASFDAGATILKTHPGAKNPKAVLIENKDSYMLSECSAENKFLIIELSEDIWIDTLVLANYEFFSSMIKNFRVSVSDKYPVKIEKWKDIGTYEARNSREIQAFLIENPQIWARYIRIEFLSHFGNEYYCPLSLVRVHGTRMLESWKETEGIGEDDDGDNGQGQGAEEQFVPDAVADIVQKEERMNLQLKEAQAAIDDLIKTAEVIANDHLEANSTRLVAVNRSLENIFLQPPSSPWKKPSLLDLLDGLDSIQMPDICPIADTPIVQPNEQAIKDSNVALNATPDLAEASTITIESAISTTTIEPSQSTGVIPKVDSTSSESSSKTSGSSNIARNPSDVQESISSIAASVSNKPAMTSQKNKTTGTSSAASSLPTIQESFFKAVSRRLQLLEANSTLSLKYIEEQSKILREAFSKVEKKQLQKTTTFLDTLNSTVLAELRVFRQQYDEIWQSTVISLESQREESRREILAISARLNILADEVVFQKRMSIVQSFLLLLCLGLVIFSRVSAAGQLDFPNIQSRARALGSPMSPLESPSESPEFRRTSPMRDREQWLDDDSRRELSDGSPIPLSRSREGSPPTPVSTFSRSDRALTPPSGGDDPAAPPGHLAGYLDYLELPSSSPARSSKKRRRNVGERGSSQTNDSDPQNNCLDDPPDPGASLKPSDAPWADRIAANDSSLYPTPPPEVVKSEFSTARKPLPDLPFDE